VTSPTKLDFSVLAAVPLSEKVRLPKDPGVYFVVDASNVVHYIGASTNVRRRWASHHRISDFLSLDSVRILYLPIDKRFLHLAESEYIRSFLPCLNGSMPREGATTLYESDFCSLVGSTEGKIPLMSEWLKVVEEGADLCHEGWKRLADLVPASISFQAAERLNSGSLGPYGPVTALNGLGHLHWMMASCDDVFLWASKLIVLAPSAPVGRAMEYAFRLIGYAQQRHWEHGPR
jgi:hypothetical protein